MSFITNEIIIFNWQPVNLLYWVQLQMKLYRAHNKFDSPERQLVLVSNNLFNIFFINTMKTVFVFTKLQSVKRKLLIQVKPRIACIIILFWMCVIICCTKPQNYRIISFHCSLPKTLFINVILKCLSQDKHNLPNTY